MSRTQNFCPPQMLRACQNESTYGKHDHVSNVAATMCPRFAAILGPRQNENTLWRQHCVLRCGKTWQHCCAPRGHKKCFWSRFRNIFSVQDTKFLSPTNVARVLKRVNIRETWSRQQYCRHNVSSFCRPLTLSDHLPFKSRVHNGDSHKLSQVSGRV